MRKSPSITLFIRFEIRILVPLRNGMKKVFDTSQSVVRRCRRDVSGIPYVDEDITIGREPLRLKLKHLKYEGMEVIMTSASISFN